MAATLAYFTVAFVAPARPTALAFLFGAVTLLHICLLACDVNGLVVKVESCTGIWVKVIASTLSNARPRCHRFVFTLLLISKARYILLEMGLISVGRYRI